MVTTWCSFENRLKQFVSILRNKLTRLTITSGILLSRNAILYTEQVRNRRGHTIGEMRRMHKQTHVHLFDVPRRCLHPASNAPNNRTRPVLFSCRATEPTDKLHSDPLGNPTKL